MKEVNKNILRAATIITKSLLVLDKLAQDEEHPVVAQELAMINGALALLGNANFRNNLARWFVMKRELKKVTHLCTDKVPMTGFLFGDDVSKSVKQIEKSMKLKSTIAAKKLSFSWHLLGSRTRGFGYSASARGFSSGFQPYGSRMPVFRGAYTPSQGFHNADSKNARNQGTFKSRH